MTNSLPLHFLASASSGGSGGHEHTLLLVLVQISIIIVVARVAAIAFRKIGQPAVVGEIFAGLILGPSLFGKLAPNAFHAVFNPQVAPIFEVLAQLGLIFLLFLIGLEFDFSHLKTNSRAALSISVAGVVLPFLLGFGLAHWLHLYLAPPLPMADMPILGNIVSTVIPPYIERYVPITGFSLFMGTAMSITAIPILGRMMMELNITRTRLGAITITAAAIDDASGWILLAAVSALVTSAFSPIKTVQMIGLTLGFALLMAIVVRPLLARWIHWSLKRGQGELGVNALAILFIVLFLCAVATSLIGIFAIFGAFILGAVLSGEHEFRDAVGRQLRNFITVFFLPIFFTYTGLRTDVGSLSSGTMWIFAGLVSAAAIIGKFGGCATAARFSGFTGRESACVGVMMNTRALMELIVINVGYNLGVIPKSVFCMLVMMALLTTIMTTPILLRTMRGTELEVHITGSGFARPLPAPPPEPPVETLAAGGI